MPYGAAVVILACLLFVLVLIAAFSDFGPVRFKGGYPGFPGAMGPAARVAFHRRRLADPEWYERVQREQDGRFAATDLLGWYDPTPGEVAR